MAAYTKTLKITGIGIATTADTIVKSIRWIKATTAGHILLIRDGAGSDRFEAEAAGANHEMESITERHFDGGIDVVTLDSGILYIETQLPGSTRF